MSMLRPYAEDWEDIGDGIQYSESTQRWYVKGVVYDRCSAQHNGIIGAGAQLRKLLKTRRG